MIQPTTLGQRIYRLRRERGMSQEELSECLDVSRQSISKWETDGSIPDLDKLIALSELFGVTLDVLVKGETCGEVRSETPNEAPVSTAVIAEPIDTTETTAEIPPSPAPVSEHSETPAPEVERLPSKRSYRTVGIVFLIASAVLFLLLFLLSADVVGALLWTSPLIACGLTCCTVRRYPTLWCGWWFSVTFSTVLSSQSIFRFYCFDLVSTLYTYLRADHLPTYLQPNPIGVIVHAIASVIVITMMVIIITLYSHEPIRMNRINRRKCILLGAAFLAWHVLVEIVNIEIQSYMLGDTGNSIISPMLSRCGSVIVNLNYCMRVAFVTMAITIFTSLIRNKRNDRS